MTAATLGFAIDSSPAATAASDLDKLTSSAVRAEQAAGKTGAAGTRMAQSFNGLSPTLDKIVSSLGRLETITTSIDTRLAAMATAAGKAATATGTLDKAAIEASSSYRALEASMTAVQAAQGKADASLAKSLGMIDKQRDAIAKLNAELAKLRNNPGPNPNVPKVPKPANQNGNQGSVGNITSQLFDVFGTAPFMSATTVGLQQGPQMAQAFAGKTGKEAVTGLVGGLTALASPVSLAAIGLTTAAAAAIQFGAAALSASTETKNLDDVLDDHAKYIKAVEERYGSLAEAARGASMESAKVLNFQGSTDKRVVRSATNLAQYDLFKQTGNILGRVKGGTEGGNDLFVDNAYKPIEDALRRLRAGLKEGKSDFDAFYDSLYKAAAVDPKFAKRTDELAPFVEKLREGTKALEELERLQRAVFNDRGPSGTLLSQGTTNTADMGNYAAFQKQQEIAGARNAQALEASIASIKARSAAEKANSAGATAAAVYNNDETPAATRQRVAAAITLSQVQSEKELADAQRDRSLSLEKLLDDQKLESSLIGQTANATDDLRQKYSLTAALRAEAARKGISDEMEFQKVYGGEIEAIDKVIDKQRELITQREMMMSRTNAAVAQTKYDAGNAGTLSDLRRTQGAALGAIGAKTPQQLADAARARVLAEPVDPGKESQEVREYRASAAAALAYAQAEDQLKEAQKNRSMSLEKMLDDQRNEAALIGKTGGAAAALRKEYELASAAKMEAAQRGAEVDSAELANIKAKAAELGKLTDAYNQSKFTFDLNQQNSDARLSPRDQQITTQLRQAGLPEDLNGANAKAAGQSIDWAANKAATKSFLSDFEQNLVNNGGKIGKSFADSLKNALMAETSKLWDGIFDKLGNVVADWLTGKSGSGASGSGAGLGAIGAIGGKLFGGGTAANDNKASSGAGAALGFVGNYKSGVDPRLTDILSTAATKFPGFKVDAMSGLRAGDPRFHGKGLATDVSLTDLASGSKLANYQDPSTFGTYEKFAQTARSVQMDKYPELASDFRWGGYFGGGKGKYGAMDQMHFDLGGSKVGMGGGSWDKGLNSGQSALWGGVQSKGMTDAAKAIDKLTASSTDASKGLGQLGQLSSSFFPSAPAAGGAGGGGIGGWFSSLFGGAFKPIGAQASLAASGGITGLFAGGTNYAPGGMAIVGEQGPELVDLNPGARVINNNSMKSMMAADGNDQSSSQQQPKYEIHIHGGSGDEHIRGLVSQGIQQADGQRSDQMRRGGFGQMQMRYNSQKG